MDNIPGNYSDFDDGDDPQRDADDEDTGMDTPPQFVGQNERRMQVRAYNLWASLLQDRNLPRISDLDANMATDFGPYSVVLDFTAGIDNPAITFLGDALGGECSIEHAAIRSLDDAPSGSLLARVRDHYHSILESKAPVGFEAEFINPLGATVLYRGILLPFSHDENTVDFVQGVVNWKETVDKGTSDALIEEISRSLADAQPRAVPASPVQPMMEWADGPAGMPETGASVGLPPLAGAHDFEWPLPAFGTSGEDGYTTFLPDNAAIPDLQALDPSIMDLGDWLASARALAQQAGGCEERSRQALYAAVGRAYDFSLAANEAPDQFGVLLEEAGLIAQDRAPLTPLVKLIFGANYDKTRLAEYAAAIAFAHRNNVARGGLALRLMTESGGLKGVVAAERQWRREQAGQHVPDISARREALNGKLRDLDHHALTDVTAEGSEFTLLLARRLPDGQVVLLGEVEDDDSLLERAAQRIVDHN